MPATEQTNVRDQVPIQLSWEHKDGDIVVTPSNHDRFLIKVGRAIELLRQHQREEQFEKQFQLLQKQLVRWLERHQGQWHQAFLTAGESTLRFIVVRRAARFDADLTDALSDLGVEIANDPDLDLIKLATRALPMASEEAVQSFLDPSFTIEYKWPANSNTSH